MANLQLQSRFFRLPLEIREEIYGYLDFPKAIHLSRQGHRIVLSGCKTPNPSHGDPPRTNGSFL